MITVSGVQPIAETEEEEKDSRTLGRGGSKRGRLLGEPSDGTVRYSSAMGQEAVILDRNGNRMEIKMLPNVIADLDHSEQTLDARTFQLLGTQNVDLIKVKQKAFFEQLIEALEQ